LPYALCQGEEFDRTPVYVELLEVEHVWGIGRSRPPLRRRSSTASITPTASFPSHERGHDHGRAHAHDQVHPHGTSTPPPSGVSRKRASDRLDAQKHRPWLGGKLALSDSLQGQKTKRFIER
jgi:hypothetical protein